MKRNEAWLRTRSIYKKPMIIGKPKMHMEAVTKTQGVPNQAIFAMLPFGQLQNFKPRQLIYHESMRVIGMVMSNGQQI